MSDAAGGWLRALALRYERDINKLDLDGGKRICWNEFGNPSGYPIVFFHGVNACHLEGIWLEKPAQKHNFRIIAVDRPGWGKSRLPSSASELQKYNLESYASDTRKLFSHLNLKSGNFGLAGMSQGAPFATAHLKFWSDLEPQFALLFAGQPLTKTLDLKVVPKVIYNLYQMGLKYPLFVTKFVLHLNRWLVLNRFEDWINPDKLDPQNGLLGPCDKATLAQTIETDATGEVTYKDIYKIIYQTANKDRDSVGGSYWGSSQVLHENIGFDLGQIGKNVPIRMYHGTGDYIIPLKWAKMYIKELEQDYGLKGVKMQEFEGNGHLLRQYVWDAAIAEAAQFVNK